MILSELSLSCFRSFEEGAFSFCEGVNLVSGPNGAGKTNLLEAVFYLSCVKGIRSGPEGEMIRFGENESRIRAKAHSGGRERCLELRLRRGQKRELARDGIPSKPREWLGLLPAVLFTPADLLLLRGGPSERLRFLDMALCQSKPRYTEALSRYRSLHAGKQTILRRAAAAKSFLPLIEDYNRRMAETGSILHRYRAAFIASLEQQAAARHEAISGGKETLRIRYHSHAGDPDEAFRLMEAKREAELTALRSLCGAHRDEMEVSLNGRPIRAYGSQGQVRSAVIALKLGLRDLLRDNFGETPLLLLDDVLSELDSGRRRYILDSIDGGQVFITSCEAEDFSAAGTVIRLPGKGEQQ